MELKKLPKLTNVLVISFDKFHNLCKVIQYGSVTFQNVVAILTPLFVLRKIMVQLKTKGCCKKERGSYKFVFSLETVTFYCKKILQLTITYWDLLKK